MSKICLVEVGKFLDILKSQLCFKCLKIANGPHFLPRFIIQRLCTTIWPKGSYFIIFYYLFEFLITVNSFKLNKIWKNTKSKFLNLFVQDKLFLKAQDSCIIKIGRFCHDWDQKHVKKDLEDMPWKSNIVFINARICGLRI